MKIDRFKKLSIIIFSIGFVFIIVGVSYAFFTYSKTGMYNQVIEGGRMGVVYNETTGNNVTLENVFPLTDEEALTDAKEFEWTVTGYNESFKSVYYAIEIAYGNTNTSKVRFKDSDIKLSLYENDNLVFENKIFNNLNKQDIYYGMFATGTSKESPTINNYKLRLWINDNVFITDTSDTIDTTGKTVYSSSAYANLYASFKINVRANLNYMDTGYLTYDANGGKNAPEKTSLTTNKVTSFKPTMDGKGFLGWATSSDAKAPEYKSGDAYSGVGRTLYAVWSDTQNTMVASFPTEITSKKANITEVYFINDTQTNIDIKYNSASISVDLTASGSNGSVKGWLEDDANNSGKYILYVASEGLTYLTSGSYLFSSFSSLINIDFTNADTNKVKKMDWMFNSTENLSSLDVSDFNTSSVTDMSCMFNRSGLINLDISNFDTSNVTNMNRMFDNCTKLTSLNISNFDTGNVTSMKQMFNWCFKLEKVDVGSFDTHNVTDMSKMFDGCNSLTELNANAFNTSKVTDMNNMFFGCSALITLDISNFDTSNVTNMSWMFYGCTGLTTLDLSSFNTSKVTNMTSILSSCKNIMVLDISSFDLSDSNTVLTIFDSMFSGMSNSCQVKVKDTDAQNWVLNATNAHPTSWSTSNVLIQA